MLGRISWVWLLCLTALPSPGHAVITVQVNQCISFDIQEGKALWVKNSCGSKVNLMYLPDKPCKYKPRRLATHDLYSSPCAGSTTVPTNGKTQIAYRNIKSYIACFAPYTPYWQDAGLSMALNESAPLGNLAPAARQPPGLDQLPHGLGSGQSPALRSPKEKSKPKSNYNRWSAPTYDQAFITRSYMIGSSVGATFKST